MYLLVCTPKSPDSLYDLGLYVHRKTAAGMAGCGRPKEVESFVMFFALPMIRCLPRT
jgi:hypothetical protein